VAYINVDVSVRGSAFHVASAPLLNDAIIDTTHEVLSPNQTKDGQTVHDLWNKIIHTMGSGSDFTAFQYFAGIPSIDLGFGSTGDDDAVYHYHSNYDSFHWMDKYGDPGWHYHVTMSRIWGILMAKLVESPVLPMKTTTYSEQLHNYLESVKQKAAEQIGTPPGKTPPPRIERLFLPLTNALADLKDATLAFDDVATDVAENIAKDYPWWKFWKKVLLWRRARKINTAIKLLERQFLYAPGLSNRPWFKHVVFAPGRWTGYAGATFPGLTESIEDADQEELDRWIDLLSGLLKNAQGLLLEAVA